MPALAIAAALRDRGAEVEFAGGERAEAELVPAAGYPFHPLDVAGLDRRNPLRAARAAGLAARAVVRARKLIAEGRFDAVMGGGGYVAGPVGLAALTRRVPLALTEADSHLGIANRALAPFARAVFLAFPLQGRDGARYEVTGRPIPPGTGAADRAAARRRFAIPEGARCLLVFGGSLGARRLNEAALEAFGRQPAGVPPLHVLHACGRRDYDALRARLDELGTPPHYRLEAYIEPFADAYAAADLACARAGGSVFELGAAGLPAILVPYPHATADHQAGNARWLEEAGAAVVVPDEELDAARLASETAALLEEPGRLDEMGAAARALSRPDAAERIADGILDLARNPKA
ncbi:MAG: UDP-N-acetylglucosamine--N-acetylmuramyl-(pentapeptide) pyrophosphoryl-undecaprenol [Thermoleophilaceae bacterium]|nr:UDP-N-acetylglucosamine--N-acetylmuramyl-(pentapeptide) pyrophosphoryl-undecaprenol [Thermoleophilaceae bacterium]